ncbi:MULTISPECIES: hypothetical protein [unclassified Actinotalea]|uniref:hypothetical protein n=1 Tax=unclassified Actinotalea TaxID=2638618 RepID=UPI0015F49D81|nr:MULTISPECIES: hypothetical protein [unclassified Actinotalea]
MTDLPTPETPTPQTQDDRRRKRAALAKLSLAGVAVLGVGAALTTAVWTDDAWFSAAASAVDPDTAIDLRGAFNEADPATQPTTFEEADDAGTAVAIPASVFANLTAGDSVTVPVWIKNEGTSALAIANPVVETGDAGLFAVGGATAELDQVPATLQPGEVASVDLTIALPADADRDTFGGATGDVTIQFQGSIANRN